jgi:hypothetical protein
MTIIFHFALENAITPSQEKNDSVKLLGENTNTIKKTPEILITHWYESEQRIRVNADKTKYTLWISTRMYIRSYYRQIVIKLLRNYDKFIHMWIKHTNKIGIEFHEVQQCFLIIIIKHVSANDGHHRKATDTSKKLLHVYYVHVLPCKG